MLLHDTLNPIRILQAVKLAVAGVLTTCGMLKILKSERGEAGDETFTQDQVTEKVNAAVAEATKGGGDYKSNLPPEIKDDPVFNKYETANDAFGALVSAQKFLGRETLPTPKDANDKEAFALIDKVRGVPESPDKYELPSDLNIPKEITVDEAMTTEFKKVAHENRMSPQAFSNVYKWYMNTAVNKHNATNEGAVNEIKETDAALRSEWGAAYAQNVELAKKVFTAFSDEKSFDKIKDNFGNNPDVIKLFANIGKAMSEDQLSGKPQTETFTPAEAKSELDKIKNNLKHPYWNANMQGHKEAVERFTYLVQLTEAGG